jgi:hypothetical protein
MKSMKEQFQFYSSLSKQELLEQLKQLDATLGKQKFKQSDSEIAWLEVLSEAKFNK